MFYTDIMFQRCLHRENLLEVFYKDLLKLFYVERSSITLRSFLYRKTLLEDFYAKETFQSS